MLDHDAIISPVAPDLNKGGCLGYGVAIFMCMAGGLVLLVQTVI